MCPHLLAMKKFRVYIIGVILESSFVVRSRCRGSWVVVDQGIGNVVREPWIAERRKQGGTDRDQDQRSRSIRRYRGKKKVFRACSRRSGEIEIRSRA